VEPINVMEYEPLARAAVEAAAWDYVQGGSEDEVTLQANRAAYARLRLRPRVLVDVSACELATTVLGLPVAMPILVAPTGYQCLVHPEGELASVRAAGSVGTLFVASTMATHTLEAIAAAASAPLWFQLYVYRERAITERLVRRAEAAGYRALVLTVDTPRLGRRERDLRNGFSLPPHLRMANFVSEGQAEVPEVTPGASGLAIHAAATFDTALTWEAVAWLRSITPLPLVVKGILTAEDARLAVRYGVDGVMVSNHGGRQLDSAPATLEALPEVVEAVNGACEVYLDGGIRRGTDVLKALALGARAVLVGRPVLWGLAARGEAGARHVLELLRDELELALALAGRPRLADVDGSLVRPV
jgi:4-hydroxymandelate oxidase